MTDSLWGDRKDPPGGFQVGDTVGLFYSDHEDYVFDNPVGVITDIDDGLITVQVEATISVERVYLIASHDPNAAAAAGG